MCGFSTNLYILLTLQTTVRSSESAGLLNTKVAFLLSVELGVHSNGKIKLQLLRLPFLFTSDKCNSCEWQQIFSYFMRSGSENALNKAIMDIH